jgi:hypothetical protein
MLIIPANTLKGLDEITVNLTLSHTSGISGWTIYEAYVDTEPYGGLCVVDKYSGT